MKKQLVNPESLAAPRGFNHGWLTEGGRILWLAGQDASDASGAIVGGEDLVAQFEQVLKNLEAVVQTAGGEMQDIVKLNIYTTNRAYYQRELKALGAVMGRYFDGHYPAFAFFEVTALYQENALVEMEGFAVI